MLPRLAINSTGLASDGITNEQLSTEVTLKTLAHEKSCFVFQMVSFEGMMDFKGYNYALNKKWAAEQDCYFFAVAQDANSCSHWQHGIRHRTFCILQELLRLIKALDGTSVHTIFVADYLNVTSRKWTALSQQEKEREVLKYVLTEDDIHYITQWHGDGNSETSKPSRRGVVVFSHRNIQVWNNKVGLRRFLCQLWNKAFADNIPVMNSKVNIDFLADENIEDFFDYFRKVFDAIKAGYNQKHPQLTEYFMQRVEDAGTVLNSSTLTAWIMSLEDEMSPELERYALKTCLQDLIASNRVPSSLLLSETLLFKESSALKVYDSLPCHIKVRIHYAQDMCHSKLQSYEYSPFVDPEADCKAVQKDPSESRTALFYLITEKTIRPERWTRALNDIIICVSQAYQQNIHSDIIIYVEPLSSWTRKDRLEEFRAAFNTLRGKMKAHREAAQLEMPAGVRITSTLRLLENKLISEADLNSELATKLRVNQNCCGWTEYLVIYRAVRACFENVL